MEKSWEYGGFMGFYGIYSLVICYIAFEHGHRNSGFCPFNIVIFQSYIDLPKGNLKWDKNLEMDDMMVT